MNKENLDQEEKYLLHCTGFYNFLNWLDEQSKLGMKANIVENLIYLHPATSRYFALGITKLKNLKKEPFLAIQPDECDWFKLLEWEEIVIRKRDQHIYFVTKLVEGDKNEFPDMPKFIVALSFDTLEKINILFKVENLSGREFRQENEKILVNYHNKVFDLKIKKLDYNEPILSGSEKITDYYDLIRKKETGLVKSFGTDLVEPIGETSLTDEAKSILVNFEKRSEMGKNILNTIYKRVSKKN